VGKEDAGTRHLRNNHQQGAQRLHMHHHGAARSSRHPWPHRQGGDN
jgi:hypothetical protein